MNFKSLMLILFILVLLPATVLSQFTIHPGWPQFVDGYVNEGGYKNFTSVYSESMNSPLIAALVNRETVALFNENGTMLEGWPIIIPEDEEFGELIPAYGPLMGDITGDANPEIIFTCSGYFSSYKRLFVYSFDGQFLDAFGRRVQSLDSRGTGLLLEDYNNDGRDEIFFLADSIFVINSEGDNIIPPIPLEERMSFHGGCVVRKDADRNATYLIWSGEYSIYCYHIDGRNPANYWSYDFENDYNSCNQPLLLPYNNDWVIVTADSWNLYAFSSNGSFLEGFPIPRNELCGIGFSSIAPTDINSDGIAEIIIKNSDSPELNYVTLEGEVLELSFDSANGAFPDGLLTAFDNESQESLLFYSAWGEVDSTGDIALYAFSNSSPITNTPLITATYPWWNHESSAAMYLGNDTLHIVHNTNIGHVTIYDYALNGHDVHLDWPQPSGNSGGNRVYIPQHNLDAPEQISYTLPENHILYQSYPNPFNNITKICFNLASPEHVTLKVYNTAGRQVAVLLNQQLKTGIHETTFSSNNLASGVYYYILKSSEFSSTRKMVYLR